MIMQAANSKAHCTPILSEPLPRQPPSSMCCTPTGVEKQGLFSDELDAAQIHLHEKCHSRRRRGILIRLLVGMLALLVVLFAFYTVHTCMRGEGGVFDTINGLTKRALGDSTTGNGSLFVKNKLYLIIIIVGIVGVIILGIMLSAWCCRGSFDNPLCCPCYLCACCGGLACLECIGCGLCAAGAEQL